MMTISRTRKEIVRGRARGMWGEGGDYLPLALAGRKESYGVLEWRVYMGGYREAPSDLS